MLELSRVRRQPGGEDTAGGEPTHLGGPSDDRVDETDQVVAHVVERVPARRAGAPALAPQIDGEHLEVLGQPGHGGLVAPPRLGLPGDEQQRR